VLDRGTIVLEGPSAQVREDAGVVAHYLGQVEQDTTSPA